jgi:hypothetical protein
MVDAPRPAPSASRDLRETWVVMRDSSVAFMRRVLVAREAGRTALTGAGRLRPLLKTGKKK